VDGNGRWAKKRALNRLNGHKAGIEAVRETIRTSSDVGVDFLTIYSFSTENWKRSADEVSGLMNLFAKTMLAEVDGLDEENVRVVTIGDVSKLPKDTQAAFDKAIEQTKNNDGLTLVVALNYGGRDEIMRAVHECMKQGDSEITSDKFAQYLDTANIPDPELIIRTSGEMRLSNFLLWQVAYSEFVVTDCLWPDFDRYELLRCLLEFMQRDRRYGNAK
jgi:undecaprenyl diphosphate synthase